MPVLSSHGVSVCVCLYVEVSRLTAVIVGVYGCTVNEGRGSLYTLARHAASKTGVSVCFALRLGFGQRCHADPRLGQGWGTLKQVNPSPSLFPRMGVGGRYSICQRKHVISGKLPSSSAGVLALASRCVSPCLASC